MKRAQSSPAASATTIRGAAHGLWQSQLFQGRQRRRSHLKRIANVKRSSGLGQQWVSALLGFQRLCQFPHRAWTQFHFAVAHGIAKVLRFSRHRKFTAGSDGQPASLAKDGSGERNRRWLEIRSYQVQPKLFRPLTDADAGPEQCGYQCWCLFIYRRVAQHLPLLGRRISFYWD